MNTQEFVSSLTKKQCRYLLRYTGFYCAGRESRGELRFAVERNLRAGTIGRSARDKIFGKEKENNKQSMEEIKAQILQAVQKIAKLK